MKNLDPKVSIVIPAYNEESHIAACLQAITAQETKPFEVIVVDNGSTDKTVAIAEQFPFVRIVVQSKRGLVHARDKGYDSACGDIIGRIDADTLLPKDWVSKVVAIFSDKSVEAVSGGLHFYDICWNSFVDKVDAYWRDYMARKMTPASHVFLLGSNMALRRSAWAYVRDDVCRKHGIHEDLDLALHLSDSKLKVIFEPSLMAGLSARRVDTGFIDFIKYCLVSPFTYVHHGAKEHKYMYPLVFIVIACFLVLKVMFRAFDDKDSHFSLKSLVLSQSAARANPADLV